MLHPTYPSDRGTESPDPGVVVDTISVRFPASDQLLAWLPDARLQRIVDDDTGEIVESATGGQYAQQIGLEVVRLYAGSRTGSPQARVTFSAPKLLHKHNTEGAPLDLIPDCVDVVLEQLGQELPDVPGWRDVEVVRLDLVRDFRGLENVSATLEGICRLPVPRGGRHQREHALDGRLVYFLKGFSRSWKTRGYDKAHQLADAARVRQLGDRDLYTAWAKASSGRLRYELELARDLLIKKGLNYVDALRDEKALTTLAEDYFDHANFSAITRTTRPVRAVLAALRANGHDAEARNLLVYLSSLALGEDPPLTRHTLSRAKSIARRNSLTGDIFAGDDDPRRLDFHSGRELVGDEALRVEDADEAS